MLFIYVVFIQLMQDILHSYSYLLMHIHRYVVGCSANQTKFMQERIAKVENNFGNLCDGFAKYARGLAKVRDRGN